MKTGFNDCHGALGTLIPCLVLSLRLQPLQPLDLGDKVPVLQSATRYGQCVRVKEYTLACSNTLVQYSKPDAAAERSFQNILAEALVCAKELLPKYVW